MTAVSYGAGNTAANTRNAANPGPDYVLDGLSMRVDRFVCRGTVGVTERVGCDILQPCAVAVLWPASCLPQFSL
jgi:hypothetical protein